MAKIAGTITRLVEAGYQGPIKFPPRVFFRPSDPGVLRTLDGSSYTASGEIPVQVADLAGFTVGDEGEFEVGT